MMKTPIVFIIICLLTLNSCAKRGSISGGLIDSIPPTVRMTFPKNGSVDFKGNTIKITFDEYIKLKDINKQLIISPPMNESPLILPNTPTKQITIKIKDTLRENSTYSFNFGQSIQDNNEGNILNQYKYIFSTGRYIDSLYLEGTIRDAYELKTDNFISVFLFEAHEKFNDSTVYKEKPRYVTNTLETGNTFKFENLKAGDYHLIALKDKNNNLKYDPKSEKIGFYSQKITLPDNAIYELELFKEKNKISTKKPIQASGNRYFLPVEGEKRNIQVMISNWDHEITTQVSDFAEKDSVQLWLPKQKVDSLKFKITAPNYEKEYILAYKNQKTDSLYLSAIKTGTVHFRENFGIKSSIPIQKIDFSKMKLIDKDSLIIDFVTRYEAFDQTIWIEFEKNEDQKYSLSLLPDAIKDIYQNTNDTLLFKFNTRNYVEYGNLRLNLNGVKSYPLLVELTDDKGKILATAYTEKDNLVEFKNLQPNLFYVRFIYDTNKNRRWDAGNYLEKQQSEEAFYHPTAIDVRANWDVEQNIDLPN